MYRIKISARSNPRPNIYEKNWKIRLKWCIDRIHRFEKKDASVRKGTNARAPTVARYSY